MTDDNFALEGRTYFQRRRNGREADPGSATYTYQRPDLDWHARDVVTGEQHCVGKELPSEVHAARVTRDMLLPYIAATRTRLREIEQALGRLDRGDPLTQADQVAIAACGFGAALVGGCPSEIYQQGEQLALDILRVVDPSEARVTGAYLRGVDLSRAKLAGSDLSSADLRHAILRGADLARTNLSEAKLIGADLSGANLSGAKLNGAYLRGAYLREADLIGTDLRWADLSNVDLSRANLWKADLSGADLGDTNLSQANLSQAELRAAYLRRADLRAADLTDACLKGADLSKANLNDANLSRANLNAAILSRTDLRGAIIAHEQLARAQYLKDVIFPDGSKYADTQLCPTVADPWYPYG